MKLSEIPSWEWSFETQAQGHKDEKVLNSTQLHTRSFTPLGRLIRGWKLMIFRRLKEVVEETSVQKTGFAFNPAE